VEEVLAADRPDLSRGEEAAAGAPARIRATAVAS
jgi:hypothetical protein